MAIKRFQTTNEKNKALRQLHDDFVPEYALEKAADLLANYKTDSEDIRDARALIKVAREKVQAHNAKIKKLTTRVKNTPVKA